MAWNDFLQGMDNRTVGLVYAFKQCSNINDIWYDRWRTDVIAAYAGSLESIGAEPYLIDVNSFGLQAFSGTLPKLDCVFNLNAGSRPLANYALVPCIATWLGIPALPCSPVEIIVGEHKVAATMLAQASGMAVPAPYLPNEIPTSSLRPVAILKPRDLGASIGIRSIFNRDELSGVIFDAGEWVLQEFVEGYDITIPIVLDPISGDLVAMPGTLFLPNTEEPELWIYDAESKINRDQLEREDRLQRIIVDIPGDQKDTLVRFAKRFGVISYCRVDMRLRGCNSSDPVEIATKSEYIFIEINTTPMLCLSVSMLESFRHNFPTHPMAAARSIFNNHFPNAGPYADMAFLLTIALYSKLGECDA